MRAKLARAALKFFSPMTQQETLAVLGRQPSTQATTPLGGFDFLQYLEKTGDLPDAMKYANVVRQLLETMARTGWLMIMGPSGNVMMPTTYYYLKENTAVEQKGLFTLSNALGIDFLHSLIAPNLVHLSGVNAHGDEHGGTGMLIAPNVVLTCAHVIRDMTLYPKQEVDHAELTVKDVKSHPNIDVGLVYFDQHAAYSTYALPCVDPQVGMDVAIFGYPKIPYAKHAPLTMQKGEVTCGEVLCFDGTRVFLFSAIARPGNSGGPILSADGRFLGIVTEDLMYKDSESPEKYFHPHFAGIPTSEVVKAISDMDASISLPVEDYQ
ncbi:serine protease [Duganella sp.]|uniref:S1 family peptidase n=1 Tax=Duganella sp. TaxID=1904440 RepID=UPI0031E0D96A